METRSSPWPGTSGSPSWWGMHPPCPRPVPMRFMRGAARVWWKEGKEGKASKINQSRRRARRKKKGGNDLNQSRSCGLSEKVLLGEGGRSACFLIWPNVFCNACGVCSFWLTPPIHPHPPFPPHPNHARAPFVYLTHQEGHAARHRGVLGPACCCPHASTPRTFRRRRQWIDSVFDAACGPLSLHPCRCGRL